MFFLCSSRIVTESPHLEEGGGGQKGEPCAAMRKFIFSNIVTIEMRLHYQLSSGLSSFPLTWVPRDMKNYFSGSYISD